MSRVLAGAALLVVLIAPAGQSQDSGAVNGRVRLTTRARGTPLPSNVYQPRAVNRHVAGPTPEIRNVIVYLKNVAFRGVLPTSQAEIHQENESFVPRVLAITRGSTVEFPNDDPFFHNVFSLSSAATFNLGRYPKGKTSRWEFRQAGLVKVFCNIHSHMAASILELDHPYFAIPDLDGAFTLPSVPPGHYTLVGWHERIGERATPIDVRPGRGEPVELALPVEDTP
jgi:plastocyanin